MITLASMRILDVGETSVVLHHEGLFLFLFLLLLAAVSR